MNVDDDIIFKRLFDKLDKIEENIKKLCDRLTSVENKHENHLHDLELIRAEKDKIIEKAEKAVDSNSKKIYLVIAVIGGMLTILQIYALIR